MFDLSEINRKAWNLAISAMIYNKNWEAFSKSRIRMMYEATIDDLFEIKIRGIIANYDPPGGIGEKRCCTEFGNKLLDMIRGADKNYARELVQYTMWNVHTLEKYVFGRGDVQKRFKRMLRSEGITDKTIIEKIREMERKKSDKRRSP